MPSVHTKFYIDKQNAKLFGVCAGISDFTGIDATWIRIATVGLTFMSGPIIPFMYMIATWVAPKKPINLYSDQKEQKFWQGVRQSPARTSKEIRSRFRDIDRRLADIESFYVSNNKQLSDEINNLR